jgi:hypothetical protein
MLHVDRVQPGQAIWLFTDKTAMLWFYGAAATVVRHDLEYLTVFG